MVFREEEKQTRFRGLLENHAIFRRVLGIPKRRIGHLTPNRITLFLNDFVETITYQNRQTEETFTAILSACPIEKYLSGGHYDALNFYGADDETLERICKKFADLVSHLHELFALKTPTNQGKSAASSEIFFLTQKTAGVTLYHAPAATDAACRDSVEGEERAAIAEFGG